MDPVKLDFWKAAWIATLSIILLSAAFGFVAIEMELLSRGYKWAALAVLFLVIWAFIFSIVLTE